MVPGGPCAVTTRFLVWDNPPTEGLILSAGPKLRYNGGLFKKRI